MLSPAAKRLTRARRRSIAACHPDPESRIHGAGRFCRTAGSPTTGRPYQGATTADRPLQVSRTDPAPGKRSESRHRETRKGIHGNPRAGRPGEKFASRFDVPRRLVARLLILRDKKSVEHRCRVFHKRMASDNEQSQCQDKPLFLMFFCAMTAVEPACYA